ncbi:hypothetical protein Sps_01081 [Shewanella psychrophila]|uniref:Uncharacterized protein n=1 Tax=Shewanella psychrophila TaxID=225848 RepID=A0A1S6HL92_9GAMM|nr:hypothetical protein [Shewanella psychrophila]AQS36268.1 hypothetical protein Sps_01081 [Shewanella psychrophila]
MQNSFILTSALQQTSASGLGLQETRPALAQLPVTPSALVEENINEGTRFSPKLHRDLIQEIQTSLDEQFDLLTPPCYQQSLSPRFI